MRKYEQFEELNLDQKKDLEIGERLRGTTASEYDWRWLETPTAMDRQSTLFSAPNEIVLYGRKEVDAAYPPSCLAYLAEDVSWDTASTGVLVPNVAETEEGHVPYSLYIPDLDTYLRYL
jgi:hypothetical protein